MSSHAADPVKRGRPVLTPGDKEATRSAILKATERVLARSGFHGVTVAKITDEAGLVKSRFYHHFSSAREPVQLALESCLADLQARLAVQGHTPGGTAVELFVSEAEVFLAWSADRRHLLPALFAGMNERDSWTASIRHALIGLTAERVLTLCDDLASRRPSTAEIEAFVVCVLWTVTRLRLETAETTEDVHEASSVIVRAAIGLLGDDAGWREAVAAPGLLKRTHRESAVGRDTGP